MTILQHASFHGTQLDIIDHNGQRWLTAEQVGLALGYNEANAKQGIINLYNRNKDEFTDQDSTKINLISLDKKQRDILVFSASGCNLLSFFSSTKRAKQFRAWAKQALLVEQQAAKDQSQLVDKLKDHLMTQHLRYRQVYRYLERGFSTLEIARCMQVSSRAIRMIQAEMRELELTPDQVVFEFAHTGRIARTTPTQLGLEV